MIHFNFGLHDLKYVDEARNLVDPAVGRQVAGLGAYEANLRRIVEELKQVGADLIWCATTPVPAGSPGRIEGDEKKYNAVAAKIMAAENVPINDLWAIVKSAEPSLQLPNNVHFTSEGYGRLAGAVASKIAAALRRRQI